MCIRFTAIHVTLYEYHKHAESRLSFNVSVCGHMMADCEHSYQLMKIVVITILVKLWKHFTTQPPLVLSSVCMSKLKQQLTVHLAAC